MATRKMVQPAVIPMSFHLEDESYADFIHRLRSILAEHPEKMDVCNNAVLAKQTGAKQPARWIYIRLVGSNNQETTVAIRDDNVYLFGFRNKDMQWYEFGYSGRKKTTTNREKSKSMLKNESTFLECDLDYKSIVGGAMKLVNLPLGKRFACDAISRLSSYKQASNGEANDQIKRDLASLIVMICEATRMNQPYNTVKDGWHRVNGRKIDRIQVKYIWNWKNMSHELLLWNGLPAAAQANFNFCKTLVDIGVKGPGTALGIVKMLLNWLAYKQARGERETQQHAAGDDRGGSEQQPPFKRSRTEQQPNQGHGAQQQQQQQQPNQGCCHSDSSQQETTQQTGVSDNLDYRGRPLVEVFAVRAGFHFVGSIAVFDGMRGQIIFENDHPIDDSMPSAEGENNLLLLTGPYAAISAMGSFAIEVEIPDPLGQGEPAADVGELNWDSYNKDNEYDKPITATITTNISGQKVEVIYAVLSDAVEVKVDINLRLPRATAETRIYGQIAARSKAFSSSDEAWSVLFDSEVKGEALTDTDDGSASMAPLPLARSIIAIPPGWPLVVKATLYDAPPRQGVNHLFACQALGLTLSEPIMELPIENGGEVQVKITTHDLLPTDGDTVSHSSQSCSDWACPN